MSSPSGSEKWAKARAGWNEWARREFGDDPARAQAAADAAIQALYQQADTKECMAAGIAAARAIPSSHAARASGAGQQPPQAAELLKPGRPGTVVGYARSVQKTSQFTGGGGSPIQTVEFQLSRPGSDDIWVQMRGMILSGPLSEGHVVEVPSGKKRGGFIQTNRHAKPSSAAMLTMSLVPARHGRRLSASIAWPNSTGSASSRSAHTTSNERE